LRSAAEINDVIEAAEYASQGTFFIYKPTWDLIISPLKFCLGKTKEQIMDRRGKSRYRQSQERNNLMRKNWELIIQTLSWVLEETDIDPLQSRRDLIPFAM
jgi:hypothetical protein